jgi:hypothetical protein
MSTGFFQGSTAGKSLGRIDPERAQRVEGLKLLRINIDCTQAQVLDLRSNKLD